MQFLYFMMFESGKRPPIWGMMLAIVGWPIWISMDAIERYYGKINEERYALRVKKMI